MQVITLLDNLCRDHARTLVTVTHDANIAALASRRMRMVDGQLEAV